MYDCMGFYQKGRLGINGIGHPPPSGSKFLFEHPCPLFRGVPSPGVLVTTFSMVDPEILKGVYQPKK